jgi:hypothetical protein
MDKATFQRKLRHGQLIFFIGLALTMTIIGAPIGVPMMIAGVAKTHDLQGKFYGGGPLNYLIRSPTK